MAWYQLGQTRGLVTVTLVEPLDPTTVMQIRRDLSNAFQWSKHSKFVLDVAAHPKLEGRELGILQVLHQELTELRVEDPKVYLIHAKVGRAAAEDDFFETYIVFGAPPAPASLT